jgi:hypothetical protein
MSARGGRGHALSHRNGGAVQFLSDPQNHFGAFRHAFEQRRERQHKAHAPAADADAAPPVPPRPAAAEAAAASPSSSPERLVHLLRRANIEARAMVGDSVVCAAALTEGGAT